MRKIKFRGLRKDGKGWAYGVPVSDGKVAYIISGMVDSNDQFITIEQWHPIIPETVGQFTGLLDKNGKEIFEEDKLFHSRHYVNTIMNWVDKFACFSGVEKDGTDNFYQKIDENALEVIGNIHEQ